jgi:hypothetical protein
VRFLHNEIGNKLLLSAMKQEVSSKSGIFGELFYENFTHLEQIS